MIANNFEEFVSRILDSEKKALNNEAGQAITEQLFQMKLKKIQICLKISGRIQRKIL